MYKLGLVMFAVCFGFSSEPVTAADFDGSKALICAPVESFECVPGSECFKDTPESINAPQFIRLDFTEKLARATRPDGEERTSRIENLTLNDGELILQGTQDGLGWNMAITQASGKMALSATGSRVAFVLFGACTPL